MKDEFPLIVFMGVNAACIFGAFVPDPYTLRTYVRDDQDMSNVRAGYTPAVTLIVLLALALAGIRRRVEYLVIAFGVSLVMVAYYEYTIRERRKVKVTA